MVIEGVKAGRDFRQVDEGDASAWRRPDDGRRLRDQDLRANAEKLGLDIKVFDKELAEHVHAERIHEDFLSGVRSGVNGTPTFTSMVRHDGSYALEPLLRALERAGASERVTR